jgi:peptidyl-prolyl cis-trans isomerase D
MLNSLRRGAGTWAVRALLALLIIAFALWGVADVFRGFGASTLATVGDRTISPQDFERAFEDQLNQLQQRFGRRLTREQARSFGLEGQVLSRLVGEAVMANKSDALGLGLSDQGVLDSVKRDPAFQSIAGQFSKERLSDLLRQNGLSEQAFFQRQRAAALRTQLSEGLLADVSAPAAAVEAAHAFRAEQRKLAFVTVPAAKVPPVADPDDEKIKAYFEANKTRFSWPELRKVAVLSLTPAALLKPEAITDDALKAAYEERKERWNSPERRTLQQLTFKDKAAAEKAAADLSAGKEFLALGKELGLKDSDIALGSLTRKEMVDSKIAEAAFALKKDEVSKPIEGTFSVALVRVTEIMPATSKSFEEVSGELRGALALEKAEDELQTVTDAIDKARTRGATLKEAAEKAKGTVVEVEAIDREGRDRNGKAIAGLPEAPALYRRIFETDVGQEAEHVELPGGGYAWIEVRGITPTKPKELAEIKDEVKKAWLEAEKGKALRAFAQSLADRIDKGESIASVAKELGSELKTSNPVKRTEKVDGLPPVALRIGFGLPKGKAGHADADDGSARLLVVVEDIIAAAAPDQATRESIGRELGRQMSADLLAELMSGLQKAYPPSINRAALDRVTGRATTQQ